MAIKPPSGKNAFVIGVAVGIIGLVLLGKFAPQVKAKIPIVKSA
jgi:hypothetical protein